MGKAIFAIFFGVIGLVFLVDWGVAHYIYNSAGSSIDQSIDAGIIKSGYVVDAQNGYVQLEENALRRAVKEEFRKNMKLDANLENDLMSHSNFQLDLVHDSNGVPWVKVYFNTQVSFMTDIEYPVEVTRNIAFESIYK